MDCVSWLENILSGQVFRNAVEVRMQAEQAGFTRGQLSAARKILGVATVSDSMLHGGQAQNWFWLTPKESEDGGGIKHA